MRKTSFVTSVSPPAIFTPPATWASSPRRFANGIDVGSGRSPSTTSSSGPSTSCRVQRTRWRFSWCTTRSCWTVRPTTSWAKRHLLRGPYLGSVRDADLLLCNSRATLDQLARWSPRDASRAVVVPLAVSNSLARSESIAGPAVGPTAVRVDRGRHVAAEERSVRRRPMAIGAPPASRRVVGDRRAERMGSRRRHRTTRRLDPRQQRRASRACRRRSAALALRKCARRAVPSLLEGFGLPAAEARAFGCPLVISQDPALNEAAGGWGESLSTRDPQSWVDAISRCLAHDARRASEPRLERSMKDVTDEIVVAVNQSPAPVSPSPSGAFRSRRSRKGASG